MWYSQYQNSHEIFCKVEPSKGISFQAPMLAGTIRKGGEEIKAMVALLVFFYNGYFGDCWTQKVHLTVTLSKIRLVNPFRNKIL